MEKLFDTHCHTTLSDGAHSPWEMLESAADKGLQFLAITDHFDIHDKFPAPLSRFDGAGREESYKQLAELKQRDFGVTFLNGIEIAQAHQFRQVAEDWLSTHEYDYVLGSCHIVRGQGDFYHMDYDKNDANTLLERYYTELTELCEWSGTDKWIDSLAHITYPLRYMNGKGDLNLHLDAVDELFRVMVKYEIALEINTGCGTVMCPEFPQIKRFYELGGRLITIGSDSHNVKTLARGINEAVEVAKAAGFTECVYYENRKPKGVKLW